MKKTLLAGVAMAAALTLSSVAQAQIKIGVAGPITGPNAAFGKQLVDGTEQAVADINALVGHPARHVGGDKMRRHCGRI